MPRALPLPRITYQHHTCPRPGDYVVPQGPRSRTAYLVLEAREVQRRSRPPGEPVWMLTVERLGRGAVPTDATTHPLYWFPRDRKPRPGERARDL